MAKIKPIKRIKCEADGCDVGDMSVKKYGDKYFCPKHAPRVKGPTLRIPTNK